jgi:hypothetical protein
MPAARANDEFRISFLGMRSCATASLHKHLQIAYLP